MTKTLVTGATYAVTSATTCTVTDANGLVLCTAEPGSQAFFVATTPTISFSDPAAVVTATFNAAPAKMMALGLLGGGAQTLPAGYIAAEFLESNRDAGADADTSIDNLRGFRVLFSQNALASASHLMNSQEPFISAPKWGADGSVTSGFGSVVYSTLPFSE